jgi:hypothetical protein
MYHIDPSLTCFPTLAYLGFAGILALSGAPDLRLSSVV